MEQPPVRDPAEGKGSHRLVGPDRLIKQEKPMFKVLTISREYGSGGAAIGRGIAQRIGWKVLDKAFIDNIARAAQVDPRLARRLDESTDSWYARLRRGLWRGAFEAVAPVRQADFFDAETMAALARNMIEEAWQQGNHVIIGRGGQCVLHNRKDVLHIFIYAPWDERIACVQQRLPDEMNIEDLIRSIDRRRTDYIRANYGCDRMDPHLYQLMINSALGQDSVISLILKLLTGDG